MSGLVGKRGLIGRRSKKIVELEHALEEERAKCKALAKQNNELLDRASVVEERALVVEEQAALLSSERVTGTIAANFDAVLAKITWIVQVDQPFKSHSSYNSSRLGGAAVWYWEEDAGHLNHHATSNVLQGTNFVRFTEDVSQILEGHYQSFKENPCYSAPTIDITSEKAQNPQTGSKYLIDFQEWMQTNVQSNYQRKIRRETSEDQVASTELPNAPFDIDDEFGLLPVSAGQHVQAITLHQGGEWILGHVVKSGRESDSPNASGLPNPGLSTTSSADETIDQPTLGWIPLDIAGPLSQHTMIQTPTTWSLGNTVTSVVLPESSQEYGKISTFFCGSLGGQSINITSIKRIQNTSLWNGYEAKKQSMQLQVDHGLRRQVNNTGPIERSWLFHGTSEECANKIIHQGFNRAFAYSRGGSYGMGVYFARDSSLSLSYVKPSPAGDKHMFVCRVLVGDWCQGRSGMLVPDSKPHNAMELYDTVVNSVGSPSQYVTFHDSQAYPEYLVTFK